MKLNNILLASTICFILTLAASAQNCINRDGSPTPADSLTYKVYPGNFRWTLLSMPVAGRCHIEFESYDDRDEIETAIMDTAGTVTGVKPRIKGDVEILVMDYFNYVRYVNSKGGDALWSSQRVTGGVFDARLPAGQFYLVINNRRSPARKSVTLTLGQGETLAPNFAPKTTEANTTNRNYSDSDDPQPIPKSQ